MASRKQTHFKRRMMKELELLLNVDLKTARLVIDTIFQTIAGSLNRKEKVWIKGFGTFRVTPHPSRRCFNKYGGGIIVTHYPHLLVRFRPYRPFYDDLNDPTKSTEKFLE